MTSSLGPKPEPETGPKEPNPGGVDRVDTNEFPSVVNELDPEFNPAIEDAAPDEISELEDTETQATSGEDGHAQDGEPS